jgi:hypothetical protein
MESYTAGAKFDCLLFGEYLACMERNGHLVAQLLFSFFDYSLTSLWLASADIDDTLYPLSVGLNQACRDNIQGKQHLFPSTNSVL